MIHFYRWTEFSWADFTVFEIKPLNPTRTYVCTHCTAECSIFERRCSLSTSAFDGRKANSFGSFSLVCLDAKNWNLTSFYAWQTPWEGGRKITHPFILRHNNYPRQSTDLCFRPSSPFAHATTGKAVRTSNHRTGKDEKQKTLWKTCSIRCHHIPHRSRKNRPLGVFES